MLQKGLQMGRCMSHSVKRGKSRFEQFRMIVPEDVREVIGKTNAVVLHPCKCRGESVAAAIAK